ncbi:MAG: hypothetical protein LUE98_05925 [Tannerellaceae bacterium]|nr:hypothetical protein [Tannerellaceae bacterium]
MDKRRLNRLKKKLAQEQITVLQLDKHIKYIIHYVNKYIKPAYEELHKVNKENMEYYYSFYEMETLPQPQRDKLFNLMIETITYYNEMPEYGKGYSCFWEEFACKLGISLDEKISEYRRQMFASDMLDAQMFLRKQMEINDPKQLIREMQEFLGSEKLREEDKQIVLEIVDRVKVPDLVLVFKYSFWKTFFQLKYCLEEILEEGKPETIFYKKNRKRYLNAVKKHSLSMNYIELLKIYQKIYEAVLEGNKDFPTESDNAIKKLSENQEAFLFSLTFYYIMDIPSHLTTFINTDSSEIKKKLKKERERVRFELFQAQLIRSVKLVPDIFKNLVSCLQEPDESGKSLLANALFTLDFVLRTTG